MQGHLPHFVERGELGLDVTRRIRRSDLERTSQVSLGGAQVLTSRDHLIMFERLRGASLRMLRFLEETLRFHDRPRHSPRRLGARNDVHCDRQPRGV